MMNILLKLLIYCLSAISYSALLQADDAIHLHAIASIDPPNTYLLDNNQPDGVAVRKVRHFLLQSGLKFDINLLPWVRALKQTNTRNDTLIFNIGRTAEREDKYHWIFPLGDFVESLISKNSPEMNNLSKE